MKIIFGLGNPGPQYEFTRHNIGFQVIDKLVSLLNIKLELKNNWLQGEGKEKETQYFLIKPLSFVNLCGPIAKEVIEKLKSTPSEFLVIVDDFSLPFGSMRLRTKGSSGGHKGLESIIYHLGTHEFPRLRIGIGPLIGDAQDFVLSKFTAQELKMLDEIISHVIFSIRVFISDGPIKAIEVCNSFVHKE
jgi:PTH1 family peptidyl-tRNA hydrolase